MLSDFPLEKFKKLIKGSRNLVFVCVGNEFRGDDYVGLYLGRKLKKTKIGKNVIIVYSAPENYIGEVVKKNPDSVVFLDAVQAHQEPGTIIFMEMEPGRLMDLFITTHSIPIETIALIMRSISSKEMKFYILGIQVKNIDFAKGMSEPVISAARSLLDVVRGV
ncbi:MAG: hydrogenase maturation protease [Nitrososphaeria archaeon]